MSANDPSSYGQPAYGSSAYGSSGYDPNSFVAPPPGGGTGTVNVPGRIALIVAVALTVFQLVRVLVIWSLPINVMDGGSVGLQRAVDLTFTVGEASLALMAVIFGAVGLGGRARPRGAAAAGLALGTSSLLFFVVTMIMPLIF